MAHQAAMDTTGHNISNVSTEGYSRQTDELTTTTPYTLPAMNRAMPGQVGTGVQVSSIQRARDQYIDRSIRTQFGSASSSSAQLGSLQELEAALGEPSANAISGSLRNFLDSMSKVAASPNRPVGTSGIRAERLAAGHPSSTRLTPASPPLPPRVTTVSIRRSLMSIRSRRASQR